LLVFVARAYDWNVRSRFLLWLLLAGCTNSPHSLAFLANRQLLLIADFDPPSPQPPAIAAFLQFDLPSGSCPTLSISADLDGVLFADAPNGTGRTASGCQLAYYLTTSPPPAADESTLRFSDASGVAFLSGTRILERRALAASVPNAATIHAGDVIDFVWSTETDTVTSVGGAFISGSTKQDVSADVTGTTAHVVVPPLGAGDWQLSMSALADAAITNCTGAAACSVQVSGRGSVAVTISP